MRNKDIQACIDYILDSDDVSKERVLRIQDYIEILEGDVAQLMRLFLRTKAAVTTYEEG